MLCRGREKCRRAGLSAEDGNVTIIFALSLIVLLGAAGAAVDYVRFNRMKTVYDAAADSAALAAVAAAVKADRDGASEVPVIAKAAAQSVWAANLSNLDSGTASPTLTVKMKHNGKAWTADVDYGGVMPTSFLGALGVKSVAMTGAAQSSTTVEKVNKHWEFSIVVDDSSSMGIGATQADMDAMNANPKIKCSFACHWANYAKGETDSASVAKAAGTKLRIDIVDEAVDGMIEAMKEADAGDYLKARLFGLNNTVDQLVELSASLENVSKHDIQLSTTSYSVGNTNYRASMSALTTKVGAGGDGSSAAKPLKGVFIVTDGIHDSPVWESNVVRVVSKDHQVGPLDPAFCSTLKSTGVKVGVLYINYITPAGYGGYIDPYKSSILPNLKSCASDGLFFNATTPEGIKSALLDMLAATFKQGDLRLTQ